MRKNSPIGRLYNGIVRENPTIVIVLGICPTLAVTTSAINGIGLGLSTTAVLAMSGLFISLLRKVIPDKVHIPAFIVIIASFAAIVNMLMAGFMPELYLRLGIYIPLIAVNCIILGRAETYASKHGPIASFFDGIGMGIGFTLALTVIGIIREFLGAGAFFGNEIGNLSEYMPSIFVMAPGAFMVIGTLIAIRNFIINKIEAKRGLRLPVTHTDEDGALCSICALRESCTGKLKRMEEEEAISE